jgi:hypothetical protein
MMNEPIRTVSSARTGQCSSILRRLVRLLAVAALFVCALPAARAQLTTADIVGLVTDASGAVIPGASVTVINLDTHEQRAVTTSSSGESRLQDLDNLQPCCRGRRPSPERCADGHRRPD